jgi:hypothetical protein
MAQRAGVTLFGVALVALLLLHVLTPAILVYVTTHTSN